MSHSPHQSETDPPQPIDFKQELNQFAQKQAKLFDFLLDPESYLLCAGILSGVVALAFLILNAIALSCLAAQCSALDRESNTLQSWVLFELMTAFFLATCFFPIRHYLLIKKQKQA